MSKKRKTRKQKLLATLRHQSVFSTDNSIPTYSFSPTAQSATKAKTQGAVKYSSRSYAHVLKDMRQTLLITSILVGLSIIFYTLIQTNVVELMFLGY